MEKIHFSAQIESLFNNHGEKPFKVQKTCLLAKNVSIFLSTCFLDCFSQILIIFLSTNKKFLAVKSSL